MGSKAEYEARKAAKLAKRAAEEAAKRQAVTEGCVVKDVAAPAGDDQELRYEASLAVETAAYESDCLLSTPSGHVRKCRITHDRVKG
jgi:hypothetical protein